MRFWPKSRLFNDFNGLRPDFGLGLGLSRMAKPRKPLIYKGFRLPAIDMGFWRLPSLGASVFSSLYIGKSDLIIFGIL